MIGIPPKIGILRSGPLYGSFISIPAIPLVIPCPIPEPIAPPIRPPATVPTPGNIFVPIAAPAKAPP